MKLTSLVASAAITLSSLFNVAEKPRVPPSPVGQPPFLWGVAVSGYQNDGPTPVMDWYSLEETGKVPELSGKGPDFRGHMEADLDRAASLGLNAFRASIEWARLEPRPGYFDPAEVAYVHRLLQGIRRRGMTPVITLHHFATPRWVSSAEDNLQAWENPRTAEAFGRYVAFVAAEFGHEIDHYLTFNEPSTILGGGYAVGMLSPHRAGIVPAYRATMNLVTAHKAAYETIHRLDPQAMVSLPDYHCYIPTPGGGLYYMPSSFLAMLLEKSDGWDGAPRIRTMDFLAIHYYGSADPVIASAFPPEPYRWGVYPEQFGEVLEACYQTYRLPILVAENGLALKDGQPRPDGWTREAYMVAHVKALMAARRAGIPVMGYLHWTLTDNYEWGSFTPRFGLWSVDIRSGDLTRRETPAVSVYREIIRRGDVTPELERRYPPPQARLVRSL